jgi:CDP-diacylglycerol--glycerol-3-phosphate 3-phosphatidyltransferase
MLSTLPNRLSLLRILLSPVFFVFFISSNPLLRQLSVVVFFLAALTDWYDGIIARRSNTVTSLGKFLDPLADKFLTSAAFLAFAAIDYAPWWMVWTIIIRDIAITVLRSVAESRNAHIVTSKTAQLKTFVQMAVLYYLMLLVVSRETAWLRAAFAAEIDVLLHPVLVYWAMFVLTAFTLFTGLQYLYDNRTFIGGLFGIPRRATD